MENHTSVDILDTGGVFLVCAIHHWANATSKNIDPFPCLIEGFRAANLLDRVNTAPLILDDVLSSLVISLNDKPKELFGSCNSLGQIEELVLIIIALTHSNEVKLAERLLNNWVPRTTARFVYPNLINLASLLESVGLKISLPTECLNTISYILNKRTKFFSNRYVIN